MGQQQSTQNLNNANLQQKLKQGKEIQSNPIKSIRYDGLLKYESFPFNGSVTIKSIDNQTFYLQKHKSLYSQIATRISPSLCRASSDQQNLNNCKIHFDKNQVIRVIESVVYALADMQNNQIVYKDINLHNICLTNKKSSKSFQVKLIPNNFIEKSSFQKLLQYGDSDTDNQFKFSPQMIIAFRCNQKNITDVDILHKSNIYALGIALIQVCTLQNFECYDKQTFDIYQDEIQKQLQIIEEQYGMFISTIIGNMIDYDYEQRMDPIQFAFWLNKQLQQFRDDQQENEQDQMNLNQKQLKKRTQTQDNIVQQQKKKDTKNAQTDKNQNQVSQQKKIQIRTKVIYITHQKQQPQSTYKFMNKYPKLQTNLSSKRLIQNPYIKGVHPSKQTTQRSTYKQRNLYIPTRLQQFQFNKQNKLETINTKGSLTRQNPYLQMRKKGSINTSISYRPNGNISYGQNYIRQVSKFQCDNSNGLKNQAVSFRNESASHRNESTSFRQNYPDQTQNSNGFVNKNLQPNSKCFFDKNSPSLDKNKKQQKFALFDQTNKNMQTFYERHQKLSFNSCQKSEGDGILSSKRQIQKIKKQIQRSKKLIMEFDSLNKRRC